jgi:hypothetical protein
MLSNYLTPPPLWEERLDIDDQKEFKDTKGGIRIRKSKKKITQWKKEKEQKDKKRYTNRNYLTPPHNCDCSKPGPEMLLANDVAVFYFLQWVETGGDWLFCWYWDNADVSNIYISGSVTQGNNNVYAQYRGYINDTYCNLYFVDNISNNNNAR